MRYIQYVWLALFLPTISFGAIDLDVDKNGATDINRGGSNATTAAGARSNLGLGNVTNTSDANKPVSTAQQSALDLKSNITCFADATAFNACFGLDWVTAASIGLGTSDNPSFISVHASGGNLAAANAQVTKKWITGLPYVANLTSVIYGGKHYICISSHTAGSTTEPGVGASWATVWAESGGAGDDLGDATATDIAALFSAGGDYLKADGSTGTPAGGDGITHATSDGNYYASKDGAWVDLAPTFSSALPKWIDMSVGYTFTAGDLTWYNGQVWKASGTHSKVLGEYPGAESTDWEDYVSAPVVVDYPTVVGVPSWTTEGWAETSYTVGTAANNLVQLNASAQLPAVSADLLTVTDAGSYFTTDTVGAALQELGGAPELLFGTEFTETAGTGTVTLTLDNPVTSEVYGAGWATDTEGAQRDDVYAEMETREKKQPSTLNLTTDTSITADQLLANRYISNQGASGEVDLTLPAVSYSISRTVLITEAQIAEINPPSGEAFDLNGTALPADYCIDSPATVGSKAVFTRMQDASGTWFWSVDTVRGSWVDTGASD